MGDSLDGSSNATPHDVLINTYYIHATEISKGQWDQVRTWGSSHGYTDLEVGASAPSDRPVGSVSWYGAVKWCNALSEMNGKTPCYYTDDAQMTVYRIGDVDVTNSMVNWAGNGYRLPTEAEWEKAARGGLVGKRFPWGDLITHSDANYWSDATYPYDISPTRGAHPNYPTPVGFFAANGYGVHDCSGGVFEWCWDWYDVAYYASSPVSNPIGPVAGTIRSRRGGYYSGLAHRARCFHRDNSSATLVHPGQGFRTVQTGSQITGTIASADSPNITVITTIVPEIVVEQPVGTVLADGNATTSWNALPINGSSASVTYTVRNFGTGYLTGLVLTKSGANSAEFLLGTLGDVTLAPGGSTSFTVTFVPSAGSASGPRSAAFQLASNDADENPFAVSIGGSAYSTTLDADNDGMNDWGEYKLAAFGFDWQVSNAALVSALYNNASAAGLYTNTQLQDLNVGRPLLQRNPGTGRFMIRFGLQKSTDLGSWSLVPMNATDALINGQGELEFNFAVPDNAAFFRLRAE
ncbi:MAG: SUMF1/EgtB/PvdO family nonheme iron enzyme [Prosthecobacter sp.]|uniref:SUMF1/EgtB/PvdO family nonheme iron enzyme n=1 Tax=Prosthecobacter sp. TaxID=1965333 RepID=UPI001A038751|nr:SUMF1/EgtB/PvdO family nonheme iron enzyme [Prosthecobacter sp.]MBE2282852.1 SUMF1/EgtB/PvdO family nonheme iron enzyme [Prosthecobacter sp.]